MNKDEYRQMRFIGHLPALEFPADLDALPFGDGAIRALTFDEWREFDDAYVYQESRYGSNRPLFLEVAGEFPADVLVEFEKGSDRFTRSLTQLHRALTVVTAAPLPDPRLSIRCLMTMASDSGDGLGGTVIRALGDIEREWIVFGDQYQRIVISANETTRAEQMRTWLEASANTPVDDVVSALVRCARPGFSGLNQVLHITIALDALLVSPDDYAKKRAAKAYGRRLAACIAGPDEKPEDYEATTRLMYRVRSELVHGRGSDLDIASDDVIWLMQNARAIGAWVATVASAWIATHEADPGALRAAMDQAFADNTGHASLHDPLREQPNRD